MTETALRTRSRPFVGREAELAVVLEALDALPKGAGGVKLVVGEAGMGKSRFADEAAVRAEAMGVRTLRANCPPVEGTPAYWPWSRLLRPLLTEAERRSGALPGAAGLELKERPTAQESLDARTRLFEEVRARLEQAAEPAGLLVVLDDLHDADEPSLLLFRHLAAAAAGSPLLLLGTCRPGHPRGRALPQLAARPGTSRITLRGLSVTDVERYARAVLGPAFSKRLLDSLYTRTLGHPLFVAELLEIMRAGDQDPVPESIRGMIHENLDQVPGRVVSTLRAGAVIGQEFGLAILAEVTSLDAEDLVSDLAEAADHRILADGPGPAGAFSFRHPLIREVLCEDMPALERIRLHRRTAEAMERLYAPVPHDYLGELATHWIEAATPDALVRGAACAREAAASAMAGLGYEEATRLYDLALSADLPAAERCRLLLDGATAQYRLGEIRRSLATCRRVAGLARQIGRPDLLAEAALVVHDVGDREANVFLADLSEEALTALGPEAASLRAQLTAQRSLALSQLQALPPSGVRGMAAEVMDLADEAGDPEAVFSALDIRQRSLAGAEGEEERVRLGERAVSLAARSGRPADVLRARLWRIDARLKLGQTRYVDADLTEVMSIASALRQPLVDWQTLTARATLAELAGRFTDAEQLIHQAHDTGCTYEDGGIDCLFHGFMAGLGKLRGDFTDWESGLWEVVRAHPHYPWAAQAFAATVYADLGREAEARAIFEETLASLPSLSADTVPLGLLAYLSELACAFDDSERAAQLYRALLPHGRCHVVPSFGALACEGSLSRFLGMLAACLGQLDTAEAHLQEAIETNTEAGARPFAALARFEYARLLRRRGRARDARTAAAIVRQVQLNAQHMGMRPLCRRIDTFRRALDGGPAPRLTPRETEVSRLVAAGLTNREIGDRLGISVRTAESHVDHILTKLGLSSRVQLAADPYPSP